MNNKIFLSHKFTNIPREILEYELWIVSTIAEKTWHDTFCSIFWVDRFKKMWLSTEEIYDFCNSKISLYDTMLFFLNHEEPSNGMINHELKLAKDLWKSMILVARRDLVDLKPLKIFKENAEKVLLFDTTEELYDSLPPFLTTYFTDKNL